MKYKNSIFIFLFCSILFSCNSNWSDDASSYLDRPLKEEIRPLTEAELKEQLKAKECLNPSEYLDGTLSHVPIYKHALSVKVKGLKIICNISSKAVLAVFKDIKIRLDFKSKTGTTILEKTFDIYEFIGPHGTIIYKSEMSITNQQYKDFSEVNWTIVSASCN